MGVGGGGTARERPATRDPVFPDSSGPYLT